MMIILVGGMQHCLQPVLLKVNRSTKADYAIIGAGFAGLAAARRLAELKPHARIILVDAQRS